MNSSSLSSFIKPGWWGMPQKEDPISEYDWMSPELEMVRYNDNGYTEEYHVKGYRHHFCLPATGKEWWIKGTQLSDDQVETIKKILCDKTLAPLYINHEIFKYTAKYVLSIC